jgi:hypothetical protein
MKKKVKKDEVKHKSRRLNGVSKLDICEDKLQQKCLCSR